MQIESPVRVREAAMPPMGREELAEGLMLFRAGTLKMIRLQLALEQGDRRATLETVDDLVALDRQLQDYLAPHVPSAFTDELNAERALLNREKLTLAAEVVRREPPPEASPPPAAAELDPPDAAAWEEFDFAPADERRPHRAILWFALVLALLAAAAGAAWVLAGPNALALLAAQAGLLR